MSMPFRERNPVVIGAVSLAVLALLILAAFRAQDLPLIGGGDTYYAAFSESGGLKANDEVRIAGVRVGKVETVELDGDHVQGRPSGSTTDADFGDETAAAIKVKTLLGAMYLSLEPAGAGQLDEGAEIPVERTSSPYDVVDAFSGLAETSERIDTDQLAKSLTTLADLTRNTPEEFRGGARRASPRCRRTSPRATTRSTACSRTSSGSPSVLDDARRGHHRADEGRRRPVPRAGRAARGRAQPAGLDLDPLQGADRAGPAEPRRPQAGARRTSRTCVAVLNKNEDNLDNSLRLMAPFYRVFANTLGNGPWFDTYIQNLPPVPQVGG